MPLCRLPPPGTPGHIWGPRTSAVSYLCLGSGHQLDKMLSCLCVPFTWTQKPFTFPPLLKAYCEEMNSMPFIALSKGQAFFCCWKWPMTLRVHKRGRLSALPLHQDCAEHIIYLPFLPLSHLELNLMCFISDSA